MHLTKWALAFVLVSAFSIFFWLPVPD